MTASHRPDEPPFSKGTNARPTTTQSASLSSPASDSASGAEVAERRTTSFDPSKDGESRSLGPPGVAVGTVVSGKYVVERLIGAGGMGFVMAAMHVTLGERVALKFLFTETCGSAGARFLREARIAARLKSEHVVRLMDVGANERGEPYLVLEYLEGQNLSRVIDKRGALPISEAVDLVLQACVGVAEAHSIRIVHRDLKPSNLFLTERPDGSALVKVLDFGIAKLLAGSLVGALGSRPRGTSSPFDVSPDKDVAREAPTLSVSTPDVTVTGMAGILGSPYYMSPEQVRSSRSVDVRADVWSLGVILYELLTARVPFEGSPSSVLASITHDAPRSLRQDRRDAPEGLEIALRRCFEKDPDDRWQTVGDLATALLPFAPKRSRVSVERAVRVLGNRSLTPKLRTGEDEQEPAVKRWTLPSVAVVALCLLGLGVFWRFRNHQPSLPAVDTQRVRSETTHAAPVTSSSAAAKSLFDEPQVGMAPLIQSASSSPKSTNMKQPGAPAHVVRVASPRESPSGGLSLGSASPPSDTSSAEPSPTPKIFDIEAATAARH